MTTVKKKIHTKVQRESSVPLLATNPYLDINERASTLNPAYHDEFLHKVIDIASAEELNDAYEQGYEYLCNKLNDDDKFVERMNDYIDESFSFIDFIVNPMGYEGQRTVLDSETQTPIPNARPFFVATYIHKSKMNLFWSTFQKAFATKYNDEGYKFKFVPAIFTANELAELGLGGYCDLKNYLYYSKRGETSIFVDPLSKIECEADKDYICGIVVGEVIFSPEYLEAHQKESVIDDVFDNFEQRGHDLAQDDMNVCLSNNYLVALEHLLNYQALKPLENRSKEIGEFEQFDIESEDEIYEFRFSNTETNKSWTVSFQWPDAFKSVLHGNMEKIVTIAMNMKEILQDIKDGAKASKSLMMEDNDTKMNKHVDKFLVEQELANVLKKAKLLH